MYLFDSFCLLSFAFFVFVELFHLCSSLIFVIFRSKALSCFQLFFLRFHSTIATMGMLKPRGQLDSTHSRPSLASSATSEKPKPKDRRQEPPELDHNEPIFFRIESVQVQTADLPACSKSRTRVPVSLLGTKGIAVPLGLFSSSSTSSASQNHLLCTKITEKITVSQSTDIQVWSKTQRLCILRRTLYSMSFWERT